MGGSPVESPLRHAARTDPGLRLIETLGWDGTRLLRLDLHLQRLADSAARLGFACNADAARAALIAACPAAPARLRLTLARGGELAVTSAPLLPAAGPWRIALARQVYRSDDAWLAVKSTRRAAQDAERRDLPQGIDEAIFANERGEVCEGTITSLFFDAGAGLCTPPLTSGLLPGCLRAEMLATGQCREAVLRVADLGRVRLLVGNSARGLIPALWAQPG